MDEARVVTGDLPGRNQTIAKACVVTGGAGFIGSHLARRLAKDGVRVRVVDNLASGTLKNLEGVLGPQGLVDFISGDIRDLDCIRSAFLGAQVVFHQAALTSVPGSVDDPVLTNDVNVAGTLNVLTAAKECGVKRVVVASSSAVYGNSPALPKSEDLIPQPVSPYAISKYAGEMYSTFFSQLQGIETVCLRYFNVYGPRQNLDSQYAAVIPVFISLMLSGETPVIYGDGEQSRDFVYVDDVVNANLLAASAEAERVSGQVFNIASGAGISLNRLVDTLNQALSTQIKPRYEPARIGDVRHSCASIQKARSLLGYALSVSFEEGLGMTVKWYAERSGVLRGC
ncbi:MAG: SDR family oxidoreductase [Bacillota bacterium]|jgi:nucleoside-diphosphate-sugar epimerase